MPLGTLPYQYQITDRQPDEAGTGWLLTVVIRDAAGAVRETRALNVGNQPLAETLAFIEGQVQQVMEADAGQDGLLNWLVAESKQVGLPQYGLTTIRVK